MSEFVGFHVAGGALSIRRRDTRESVPLAEPYQEWYDAYGGRHE